MRLNIAFPFAIGIRGRSAAASDDVHVRDMIEQLLFTSPGERVNRPDFGSDLMQLVFAPNSSELATALRFTLQASLQQYLGDLIEVRTLDVSSDDERFIVNVDYLVRKTGVGATAQFQRRV
ncbi:MAG: GPW/gp25 family protein [Leptothrix sp. (in: b-proteobacteria)]